MIESTQKELKEAIRLGIRPCGFCKLKRTAKCEKEPPQIVANRCNKVPNLKRYYAAACPSEKIKNNLIAIIDCHFSKEIQHDSLSHIKDFSRSDYKKAILDNIRPCSSCSKEDPNNCRYCSKENVLLDLLTIIDEYYDGDWSDLLWATTTY